jgi:hypothetical protein
LTIFVQKKERKFLPSQEGSNLGYFPHLVKAFFENFGRGRYASINVYIIRLSVTNILLCSPRPPLIPPYNPLSSLLILYSAW